MTRPIETLDEFLLYRDPMLAWAGMTYATKEEAIEMLGAGAVLTALGITQNVNDFLDNSATTFGTVMYLPKKWIDAAKTNRDFTRLVMAVGHEMEHGFQAVPDLLGPRNSIEIVIDAAQRFVLEQSWAQLIANVPFAHTKLRTSAFDFAKRYLLKTKGKDSRGTYEAHAYAVGAEIFYAVTGGFQSLDDLAENIAHGYDLDADAVGDAKLILESRLSELNATGVLRSTIAIKAVEVLKSIDPELVIPGV
jgi:hypothetical protein